MSINAAELMDSIELEDINRRIDNLIAAHPRDGWTLEEARAIYSTLAGIVRVRQGRGDLALRVEVTLVEASGQLVDKLAVWEIAGRPNDFDYPGDLAGLEVACSD